LLREVYERKVERVDELSRQGWSLPVYRNQILADARVGWLAADSAGARSTPGARACDSTAVRRKVRLMGSAETFPNPPPLAPNTAITAMLTTHISTASSRVRTASRSGAYEPVFYDSGTLEKSRARLQLLLSVCGHDAPSVCTALR
jgi:hypothetical protein